jgi:hypothetical protein
VPWPRDSDFTLTDGLVYRDTLNVAVALLNLVNKRNVEAGVSIGRSINQLIVAANSVAASKLRRALSELRRHFLIKHLRLKPRLLENLILYII